MEEDRLIDLITKELSGSITSSEADELKALLTESSENGAIYEDLRSKWKKADLFEAGVDPQTELSWIRFNEETLQRQKQKKLYYFIKVAALLAIGLGLAWFLIPTNSQPVMYSTQRGEKTVLILPDGTKVWLNELSQLSYNEDFNISDRTLRFEGEAYFEVKRDESKVFTIESENTSVKVLGTSFMVDAYPSNDFVEVDVTSGKVSLTAVGGKEVILEKGMSGYFDINTNDLSSRSLVTPNYDFWRSGNLVFEDTELITVVNDLNRLFHSHIELDNPRLNHCRFTGSFTNPTLDEVLTIVSAALNTTVQVEGSRTVLKGQGCQ